MAEATNSFIPETGENWGLYIENSLCPFKSLAFTFGTNFVPELRANIPYTDEMEDLPDRTKINLVFWDYSYYKNTEINMPRPCMMFEGEIRSPGQIQTASGSRSLSIEAKHFTNIISETKIDFLGLGDYILKRMTGESEESYKTASGVTGTIFEQFNMNLLRKEAKDNPDFNKYLAEYGINSEITDLYDFVRLAFIKFNQLMGNNELINKEYSSRAFVFYKILSRIYSPDRKLNLPWDEMFNAILFQFYNGNIKKQAGEMSFLQLMSSCLQLFLFELHITPTPKSYQYTLQPKPVNYFSPVPKCNMVLPFYQPQYQFNPQWRSKYTRLVQITQPPNGINLDPAFIRKYKNYAPKELSDKMELWNQFREENKGLNELELQTDFKKRLRDLGYSVDSLITKEEYERGKIEATNVLPSYMTNVFELVVNSSEDIVESTGSTNNISGLGQTGTGIWSTASSYEYVDESKQRARQIKYFHEKLKEIENNDKYDSSLLNNDKRSYIPQKIILVKKNSSFLSRTGSNNAVSFEVTGSTCLLRQPRYFHLFSEPVKGILPIIPYVLKSDYSSKDLAPYVKANTFSSGFYVRSNTDNAQVFIDKSQDKNYVVRLNYKDREGNVLPTLNFSGGSFLSVIISLDDTDDVSINTTVEIVCCILGMTGLDHKNIHDLSYFFSGLKSTKEIFPEELLKKIGESAYNKMLQLSNQLRNNSKLTIKRDKYEIQKIDPNKTKKIGSTQPTNQENIKNTSALNKPKPTNIKEEKVEDTLNKATANINLTDTFKSSLLDAAGPISPSLDNNNYKSIVEKITNNSGILNKSGDAKTELAGSISAIFDTYGQKLSQGLSEEDSKLSKESMQTYLMSRAASIDATKDNPLGFSKNAINELKLNNDSFKNLNYAKKLEAQSKALIDISSQVKEGQKQIKNILNSQQQAFQSKISDATSKIAVIEAIVKNGSKDGINKIKASAGKAVDDLKQRGQDAIKEQIEKGISDFNRIQTLLGEAKESLAVVQSTGLLLSQITSQDIDNQTLASQLVDEQTSKKLIEGNVYNKEITQKVAGFDPTQYYKLNSLYTGYTQPMCEYFFFYNRYAGNSVSIPSVFNPYITPGYPGFLIDNRQALKPRHLIFYVSAVTHEISHNSNRTLLDLKLVRKFSEEVSGEFTKKDSVVDKSISIPVINLIGDKVTSYREDKPYKKLFEEMQDIAFFGGEYSTNAVEGESDKFIIDETFERLLGKDCIAVRESDIEENKDIDNLQDAWNFNRREFQTMFVKFGPSFTGNRKTELEKTMKQWFTRCPSRYGYDQENTDITLMPVRIYMVDDNGNKLSADQSTPINEEIAKLVDVHRSKIFNMEGILGAKYE